MAYIVRKMTGVRVTTVDTISLRGTTGAPMPAYHPILQLAQQSALKKFSTLIQHMAQQCDQRLEQALSTSSPSTDYSTLNAARHFLRNRGEELLSALEADYQKKLDQAMQDLYTAGRVEVQRVSAANLTLVDDQTIIRQIEVGHLAVKLGSTCSESLNEVNIIISQLLNKPEVKEKDNPFRPELIARSLTEALNALVEHENVRASLTSYTTDALARSLPEYYAALRDVFRAGGINPKLTARPTVNPSLQGRQERPAAGATPQHEPSGNAAHPVAGAANLPTRSGEMQVSVDRLLQVMQQATQNLPFAPPAASQSVDPMLAFQGLLSAILGNREAGSGAPHISAEFLAQLDDIQRRLAQGASIDPSVPPGGNQLFAIGRQLEPAMAGVPDQMASQLVAVLFDMILRDQQMPDALRQQIGQLQMPILKSAMLDPATLQQSDHPTRRLLNHMGMVAVDTPPDSAFGQDVGSEINRISNSILNDYQTDASVFVKCLEQLKQFVDDEIREVDEVNRRSIEAMEEFQRYSYLTQTITNALRETLMPLRPDQRIVDFCMNIWVHVLVRASTKIDKAQAESAKATVAKLEVFFYALPDLIWSAQDKTSTEDRLTLIRVLPKLVKVISSGLKALQLPEQQAKEAMDQLLAIHAGVLANTDNDPTRKLPSREELRQLFRFENIQEQSNASRAIAPPPRDEASIQGIFSKRGIEADIFVTSEEGFTSTVETEWLAAMQPGIRVDCKVGSDYQRGRLIWVDAHQSLFLFRLDQNPRPRIYCDVTLSRALRDRAVAFVESAPTFERAVQELWREIEQLKSGRG